MNQSRAELLPHPNPVGASPDAWRATWRSCRLFLRAADVPLLLFLLLLLLLLLLITIRESDNGYRLLPRLEHGLLRKRGVEVAGCSGHAVSRIRREVSVKGGWDERRCKPYSPASDYSINQAAA